MQTIFEKMGGILKAHLEEVDKSAEEMYDQLTKQMKAQAGITEELKAKNQLHVADVIHPQRAAEIVYKELIYV